MDKILTWLAMTSAKNYFNEVLSLASDVKATKAEV